MSFSDILRNDYLDHFDTFGENFDFDTFKNDTFNMVHKISNTYVYRIHKIVDYGLFV